ncbi:efflux RND transporter periplasmic adaptor subunit [Methylobacterium durans]|uniref:efflux RND transporter periplasmic adaptor subunit n=1 Tax=Methylobacterium durans TaxID=2202825 RepID=UPI002AFE2B94|nr:efflux RND transporter periplasmic adaptor subunit [Methylobacterium durans]MEA1835240.1 efflux RND transporter periplasmic adaptor subunit [Methylobacterium durans]
MGGVVWYQRSTEAAAGPSTALIATPAALNQPMRGSFALTERQLETLTTASVEHRFFYEEIVTEGKISVDEYRATPIFSPYPGRVVAIFGQTGQYVRQGTPLFSVQANEMVQAQNDYLAALNVLNKSRAQSLHALTVEKRLRDLFETRATTLRELQVAQNELSNATNDLKTAEVGLDAVRNRLRILGLKDPDMTALQQKGAINAETMINAPLSGTIIQRKIGPGQYVATGGTDPSYVIGDLSLVWLVAHLREVDAAKVMLGERLLFRVLAHPNRTFEARVNLIGASVDPATRRIVVRGEIENSDNLLKPEMFASVSIIKEYDTVSLSVPRRAVIFEGDQASVWVLKDGNVVEHRRITPGTLNEGNLEVVEGLAASETVISKGALFVDRMATQQ